jgi:hypothetical protein
MDRMTGLDTLREQRRMTWIAERQGWDAAPEDVVSALSSDGFEQCKHETATNGRDGRPAGGLWQGLNTRTGSVASAIWVHPSTAHQAVVFIEVDGTLVAGG